MLSLAVGCGLEWELRWLGGLFTAAELAAADLLLQLRLGEAEPEADASTSPSLRSTGSSCHDLAVVEEEERVVKETARSLERERRARKIPANSCLEGCSVVEEEELEPPRIAKETVSSLGSMELDRRAQKRYRLISELYAATRPVKAATTAAKKRKRHHDYNGGRD